MGAIQHIGQDAIEWVRYSMELTGWKDEKAYARKEANRILAEIHLLEENNGKPLEKLVPELFRACERAEAALKIADVKIGMIHTGFPFQKESRNDKMRRQLSSVQYAEHDVLERALEALCLAGFGKITYFSRNGPEADSRMQEQIAEFFLSRAGNYPYELIGCQMMDYHEILAQALGVIGGKTKGELNTRIANTLINAIEECLALLKEGDKSKWPYEIHLSETAIDALSKTAANADDATLKKIFDTLMRAGERVPEYYARARIGPSSPLALLFIGKVEPAEEERIFQMTCRSAEHGGSKFYFHNRTEACNAFKAMHDRAQSPKVRKGALDWLLENAKNPFHGYNGHGMTQHALASLKEIGTRETTPLIEKNQILETAVALLQRQQPDSFPTAAETINAIAGKMPLLYQACLVEEVAPLLASPTRVSEQAESVLDNLLEKTSDREKIEAKLKQAAFQHFGNGTLAGKAIALFLSQRGINVLGGSIPTPGAQPARMIPAQGPVAPAIR